MIPQLIQNAAPAVMLNPAVAVRVAHYDLDPIEMPPKVMAMHYEHGDMIVFKNAGLRMSEEEWRLLNGVDVPMTNDLYVKKAKLKHLFQPLTPTGWDKHILSQLTTNYAKAGLLQAMMQRVTQQVRDYVTEWFPTYKVLDDQSITWRLTPTASEPIHYDYYGSAPNDYHNVRVFINLDTKPRLWAISHKVEDAIRQYRELVRPYDKLHPNMLNEKLSEKLPWDEIPRTFISFAPLNMWLVNSQVVAHEAIYGRRMLAATIACDPQTMVRPERHFVDVVRKVLE